MKTFDERLGIAKARLQSKAAIVTGAGSDGEQIGIGAAIACVFAREGARVAVVDLQLERAEQTCGLIRASGGDAFAISADVTRSEACADIVATTLERCGRIDALINNVGVATGDTLEKFDETIWQRVIDTNVKSAILMCKHSMSALSHQGGSIVNIASISGIRAMASGTAYGPSKAALIMLTREIATLYGRRGVRANAIAPGHIFSPMVASLFTPEMCTARRKVSPLGIEADTWDVALAALFLASDEARFISGVCLPVDGGVSEIGALAGQQLIND